MYKLNDVIVYGMQGIYRVDDIIEMKLNKKHKAKQYYVLKEVAHGENKIYTPIDIQTVQMRKIITKEEARELISGIPDIDIVIGKDDKALHQTYQVLLASNKPSEWVSILKTIYNKEKARKQKGIKQLAQSDHQIRKLTEALLYGELSISLDVSIEEVEQYIFESLEGREAIH